MPIVINTNIASLNAQRNLGVNSTALSKNLERLSSGYRINRAGDDAAGLQISETLRSQIRGIGQALNNSQDGYNMLSLVEGTMSVVQENLQRIRELAVQAANDTNGVAQRAAIKQEIDARVDDIRRITRTTQFNGRTLMTGAPGVASFRLQVGPNSSASLDTLNLASALGSATATTLAGGGIFNSANIFSSNSSARLFIIEVDKALTSVGQRRSVIGSIQNRLESAISNLQIARENYEASESRIRNVDVAKETAEMTRNQILQQASASILAQANQTPSIALKLLGG